MSIIMCDKFSCLETWWTYVFNRHTRTTWGRWKSWTWNVKNWSPLSLSCVQWQMPAMIYFSTRETSKMIHESLDTRVFLQTSGYLIKYRCSNTLFAVTWFLVMDVCPWMMKNYFSSGDSHKTDTEMVLISCGLLT